MRHSLEAPFRQLAKQWLLQRKIGIQVRAQNDGLLVGVRGMKRFGKRTCLRHAAGRVSAGERRFAHATSRIEVRAHIDDAGNFRGDDHSSLANVRQCEGRPFVDRHRRQNRIATITSMIAVSHGRRVAQAEIELARDVDNVEARALRRLATGVVRLQLFGDRVIGAKRFLCEQDERTGWVSQLVYYRYDVAFSDRDVPAQYIDEPRIGFGRRREVQRDRLTDVAVPMREFGMISY